MSSRWVYLHGLGSGPRSRKAAALARVLAADGVAIDVPDLRVPQFRGMRYSVMVAEVTRLLTMDNRPVVLLGTSLGSLVALRVAQSLPQVRALVLYSPALDLPYHRRTYPWLSRTWRALGHLPLPDKSAGCLRSVDAGFLADLEVHAGSLRHPTVPTLVLHGRSDRFVAVQVVRDWARDQATIQLVELEDGHDLYQSLPTVIHETRRFLGDHLGPGPREAPRP